ncbi:MAG: hypothetical protein EOM44_14940, partial [Bacteroidia bacterium]|nr:hypothetical protein [Bacteroidia bacterium]
MTEGTIVVNSDGTYTFTPAVGYSGPVPPITYTATNAEGGTDNAKFYIEVATAYNSSTNNPPVANHDVATTKQEVEVTVKPLTNDSDPDASTTLTITEIKDGQGHKITATASTTAQTIYNADGTAVGTAYVTGGELKFTPNTSYTGDVPFTYEISDGNNGTASSIINVTVLPAAATLANINANDDANVKPKDETMNGNVLTNDISSVSGLTVTGASVTIGGTTTNLTPGTASTISGVGTITLDANGDYTFDPDANFVGTVPVVYTVKNDDGSTDQATLYLTTLPTAIDQVWIGTDSKDWNTGTNWKSGTVPNAGDNIVFATEANNGGVPAVNNLVVPVGETNYKKIGNLTNETNLATVIPAGASLTVAGQVYGSKTDPAKIQVQAAKDLPNGTLILAGQPCDSVVMGTVQLYAKGFKQTPPAEWTDNIQGSPTNGVKFYGSYHWQHFGVPVEEVRADPTFYKSYLRKYHEDWNKKVPGTDPDLTNTYYAKWENLVNGSMLKAFEGYEITQDVATTYTIAGKMNYCDKTITLTREAPLVTGSTDLNINNKHYGLGQNIFGNSYTASIDITKMNFGAEPQIEPTVYLYNTGRFTDWAINGDLNEAVNSG